MMICTCHPEEIGRHEFVTNPELQESDFPVPWDFDCHPRPESPWEIPAGSCTVEGCGRVAAVYRWDFEQWTWPQVCSDHGAKTCTGCGTPPSNPDMPGSSGCESCLPQTCATCGGINHIATDRMCACWVSLEDMNVADLKAIFSADGTFSIDPVIN